MCLWAKHHRLDSIFANIGNYLSKIQNHIHTNCCRTFSNFSWIFFWMMDEKKVRLGFFEIVKSNLKISILAAFRCVTGCLCFSKLLRNTWHFLVRTQSFVRKKHFPCVWCSCRCQHPKSFQSFRLPVQWRPGWPHHVRPHTQLHGCICFHR